MKDIIYNFKTPYDKSKPSVLVDVDGVIVNFQEGIRRVLADKKILFRPEWQTSYNYDGNICCTKEQIFAEFNNPDVYKRSPFIEKALEALIILQDYANVIAYTKVVRDETIFNLRKNFCEQLNIQGYIIYYGVNKDTVYIADKENSLLPVSFDAVFDDCPAVIKMWEQWEGCTKKYIIKAPYNEAFCKDTEAIVVNSLYDGVYQYIHDTVNSRR